MSKFIRMLSAASLLLLAGCAAGAAQVHPENSALTAPTTNPFFVSQPESSPTTESATLTPSPTSSSTPDTQIAISQTPVPVRTLALQTSPIYADSLNENWTLEHSLGGKFDVKSSSYAYQGHNSISMKPTIDFGQLFFAVRKDAKNHYPRSQFSGVSFWLYSGDDTIGTEDLAVTVLGSNQYPYWVANDRSVENVYEPTFSETRLYYLDINHAIPPKTWIQVEVWLDDLIYDPEYQYITGILIKNDQGFRQTYYIDQVELFTIVNGK